MRNLNSLLMVAVAAVALSACNSGLGSDEVGYLGTRDDIIVNNSGTTQVAKTVAEETAKAKIETVKASTTEKVDAVTEVKIGETLAEAIDVPEAKTVTQKVSVDGQPMKTVTMKEPVTTQRVSSIATNNTTDVVSASTTPALPSGATGDIPPNAKPGECYAKVLIPAVTETKTERFQVSEEQKVLDRIIPAKYEITTERVKVKEARQYWKAGHGPITKVNEVTGEILCLVEEPAEYKTIEKRVLVSPEKPQYKTIPAQFDTITSQNIIKSESWEWRRILCETNLSTAAIMQIQRGLNAKGYNLAVDGKLGSSTMDAINSYQLKNGLASRGITYETLNHMGVSLAGA